MATIIAKNVAGGTLEIGGLGISLAPGEERNLTETFEVTELASDRDLRNLVEAGDIVINDGTQDLTAIQGVAHIYLETEYEDGDTSSVSTTPQRSIQVRRTSDFTLSTSYQSLAFTLPDYANDTSVINWNSGSPNDIVIEQDGSYSLSYSTKGSPDATTARIFARLTRNGTVIAGSENYARIYTQEIHPINRANIRADLFAGDVINFQMWAEAAASAIADIVVTIVKEEGVKGEDGEDGRDGTSGGAVWIFGSGPPAASLGAAGYSYLDVSSGNVYSYIGSDSYNVSVSNDGDKTLADAIRVVGPSGQEIIVDNLDTNFSTLGTWYENFDAGFYGTNAVVSYDAGAHADWTFAVDETGTWQVYAWWSANRKNDAHVNFTVTHDNGDTIIEVNQTTNGAQWNLLGSFTFSAATGWTLEGNIKGPQGERGESFRVDSYGDLNEAVVSNIEAFYGTPEDVYVYAVQVDNRVDKTTPIDADLTYHILAYDGSTWLDYGGLSTIEGPQGPPGEQGVPGIQGPQGPPGEAGESAIVALAQCFDSTGGYNINSTTPVTIQLAGTDIIDDTYFAKFGSTGIQVSNDGLYRITYQVGWYGDGSRKNIRSRLRKNGSTFMDRSPHYCYTRNAVNRDGSNGRTFLATLLADDYLEILCDQQGDAGTAIVYPYETYLLLEFIRSF